MKIIDLLNKKVNGEEMPKKIKYKEIIYYYCEGDQSGNCYFTRPKGCGGDWLHFEVADLNDEVEILEEEKKIPEKLNENRYIGTDLNVETDMFNKINEIIDYLYFKNKGE